MTFPGHPCQFHDVYLPGTGSAYWEIQQTVHLHSSTHTHYHSHQLPLTVSPSESTHSSPPASPPGFTLTQTLDVKATLNPAVCDAHCQGFCTSSLLINVHLKERFNNSAISHTPGGLKTTSSVMHSTLTLPNGHSIFEKTQLVRNTGHSYIILLVLPWLAWAISNKVSITQDGLL